MIERVKKKIIINWKYLYKAQFISFDLELTGVKGETEDTYDESPS